jgi:hypothetical protein
MIDGIKDFDSFPSPDEAPRDLQLAALFDGSGFILGPFIRDDPHCRIYKAMRSPKSSKDKDNGLEVRCYSLGSDVPVKVRNHRLRNIRRMSSRILWEHSGPERKVVVYQTELVDLKTVAGPKTPYKRESDRVRQRERRRRRREEFDANLKTSPQHLSDGNDQETAKNGEDAGDRPSSITCGTGSLWLPGVVLYLTFEGDGRLQKRVPKNRIAAVRDVFTRSGGSDASSTEIVRQAQEYLATRELQFRGVDEMECYMAIKQREIISAKRQQSRMLGLEKECNERLVAIRKRQQKHKKGSREWDDIENGEKKSAQLNVLVVKHAIKVLPAFTKCLESVYRELKTTLKGARAVEARKKKAGNVPSAKDKPQVDAWTILGWRSSIIPLSMQLSEIGCISESDPDEGNGGEKKEHRPWGLYDYEPVLRFVFTIRFAAWYTHTRNLPTPCCHF